MWTTWNTDCVDLGKNRNGFLLWMQTKKTDNQNGDWQIKPIIVIGLFPYIILGKKFPILKSGRWSPSYISIKIPTNFLERRLYPQYCYHPRLLLNWFWELWAPKIKKQFKNYIFNTPILWNTVWTTGLAIGVPHQ
jgi:hypothetical protein